MDDNPTAPRLCLPVKVSPLDCIIDVKQLGKVYVSFSLLTSTSYYQHRIVPF